MQRPLVRYRHVVMDSARWDGFTFREGDIVISTPPKCGTTWTQTICALLIFGTDEFPRALDLISPWLEQTLRPLDDVVRELEAQTHRRFIKSHTPLDGIPFDERVTYVCVGRDPRDVAMSWDNHMSNLDFAAFLALREKAVGNGDLAELMPDGPLAAPEAEVDRFWLWVETPPRTDSLIGLAAMLHHLQTFWDQRHRSNVALLHYDDLKQDLEGQMRALAGRLAIDVPEDRWPALVEAATFDRMRERAADVGPNTSESIWLDARRFFNKGTSGQWRHILDEAGLRRYERHAGELIGPELSGWVHQGPIV